MDDGFSGVSFEREGLQAMLQEVEAGRVATVKAWDDAYSADRICLCDIGLGVWSDVWQGLLVMEVWLELERGLWQVLFYLLIQKISETVPTHSHSVTILLWEVRQAQRWVLS